MLQAPRDLPRGAAVSDSRATPSGSAVCRTPMAAGKNPVGGGQRGSATRGGTVRPKERVRGDNAHARRGNPAHAAHVAARLGRAGAGSRARSAMVVRRASGLQTLPVTLPRMARCFIAGGTALHAAAHEATAHRVTTSSMTAGLDEPSSGAVTRLRRFGHER